MNEKAGVVKYVKVMKRLFIALSVVALPSLMVFLALAIHGELAFQIATPILAVAYLTAYGFYAMHVSMGTVIGIEVTSKVVHLKTKRKTFTYDVKRGCVAMRESARKFVGTFETQDSRDKFVFYRHVPFSGWANEQFTREEMGSFFSPMSSADKN